MGMADSNYPGNMSVLVGNRNGTFRPAVIYSVGNYPNRGVVGDFNGDGKPDVAIACSNGINILLGKGDGTFEAPLILVSSPDSSSLRAADFNGDGKLDLVVVRSSGVFLILGNGDGTFQPALSTPLSAPYLSYLSVADMNSDGKPDLVSFTTGYGGGASVALGNGDGTFAAPLLGPAVNSSAYPTAYTV